MAADGGRAERPMSMRRAALIQFGSKYASVVVQLVITAVLARLVSPAEFGTLAIVTVFTTFFTMFSDMGVGVAIVQFRDLDEADLRRLLGFSCVLAIGLGLLFCAASVPISWVYGDEALVPLCCASSLALVFTTLNMVPNGVMLRERRFTQIGVRLVVAVAVSGAVGIALAAAGMGCYALVIQNNVLYLVVLVWNWLSRPLGMPDFHFIPTLRRVFSYSAYQFAAAMVGYFNRNFDNLLIGRIGGAEALGYYDKAYRLTTYPMSAFSSVIASVIQPFMAEHQDDPDVIFSCWMRVAKLCSLVGAAMAALMFCCSDEITVLLYGDQWLASAPLLHALSVSVYAQMMGNPTGAFYQSLGRTDLAFKGSLVNTGIMMVGIGLGLALGDVQLVSWCVCVAFFLQLVFIAFFLVHVGFGKSMRCLRAFLPEIISGVVAVALGMLVGTVLPGDLMVQLLGKGAVTALVLLLLYCATGQMESLLSLVR